MAPYGNDVGPVGYAMAQQERQDQSMRNILNLIMSLRQYKQQQGQQTYERQQDTIQNQLAAQRNASYDAYTQAQVEKMGQPQKETKSELDKWMEYGSQNNYGGKKPVDWMMLYRRGEGRGLDEIMAEYTAKKNFDESVANRPIPTGELDKEYRGKVAAVHTNFANKSWALRAELAKQEGDVIKDPLISPEKKSGVLEQLRSKNEEMLKLAEADRQKELDTLNIQYPELPRVQQHILNKKVATDKVMSDVYGDQPDVASPATASATPPVPAIPKQAPKGTVFYKFDTDGVPVFEFPDGSRHRWIKE